MVLEGDGDLSFAMTCSMRWSAAELLPSPLDVFGGGSSGACICSCCLA
jgi:hypothetical protein